MSKGIAVLFKKKFGGVDELKKQGKNINNAVITIYYFSYPKKKKWLSVFGFDKQLDETSE